MKYGAIILYYVKFTQMGLEGAFLFAFFYFEGKYECSFR